MKTYQHMEEISKSIKGVISNRAIEAATWIGSVRDYSWGSKYYDLMGSMIINSFFILLAAFRIGKRCVRWFWSWSFEIRLQSFLYSSFPTKCCHYIRRASGSRRLRKMKYLVSFRQINKSEKYPQNTGEKSIFQGYKQIPKPLGACGARLQALSFAILVITFVVLLGVPNTFPGTKY